MNCRKVSHFLSAYMDGELPGVEHRQIHEHIGQCAACAHEYRSLLQMKRLLGGMQVREAQADLPTRLLEKVHANNAAAAAQGSWLHAVQDRLRPAVTRRLMAPQPRFQYFALAATLSVVGIVYASYAIDQSDKIDFHVATPSEIASLPPALTVIPTSAPSFLPPASSGENAGLQQVGSTYYTPYSTPMLPSNFTPQYPEPNKRRSQPAPPFFYRR